MFRSNSKTCLLNSEDEEIGCVNDFEREHSSSGYESSDYSSDEDTGPLRVASVRPHRNPLSRSSQPQMSLMSTGCLQDSLASVVDMAEMCDVTFCVGKRRVPVHGVKAILTTRSRCMYQLVLQSQRKVHDQKKSKKDRKSAHSENLMINIPDYKPEDFRHFLIFIHSGRVNIDMNNVIGLLCSAVEYEFPDLETACRRFVRASVNRGQSSQLLDLAWDYCHKKTAEDMICQLSST